MRKFAILLGGAALLAACQTNPPAPPAAPPVAVDPTNPLFAPGYMATAGSSDQFEIQSAQLALQMSQNLAVRNFANMLIADHTRSTQMIVSAAQSAGLAPPAPALLPQHQAMLDQLRAAGAGPNFDLTFKQIQIQAHTDALALHQNYAASGDVPALRAVAGQIVPVVQMHLSQAQMLNVAAPMTPPPPAPLPGRSGERG
jgi:putative membrane protein